MTEKRTVAQVDLEAGGELVGNINNLTGVLGFMSWRRLAEVLGRAGEVRNGERITHFAIRAEGIDIRYERD